MLGVIETKAYRRAIKKYSKSINFDIKKVENIIKSIQVMEILDKKYRDHTLKGKFQGIRECHIENNLLLLYQLDKEDSILRLINLGTHSELFG